MGGCVVLVWELDWAGSGGAERLRAETMTRYSGNTEPASVGALLLPWRAKVRIVESSDDAAPWFDNFGLTRAAPARSSRLKAWRERRPTNLTAQASGSSADSSTQQTQSATFLGLRWPRMSSVDRRYGQNAHAASSLNVMRCFVPSAGESALAANVDFSLLE